jgi:hypothetical protein
VISDASIEISSASLEQESKSELIGSATALICRKYQKEFILKIIIRIRILIKFNSYTH